MKIRELLVEDTHSQLTQDLQDLLINIKGFGASSIDTASVVGQLGRMGYDVSPETVLQLVAEMPMAVVADQQTVSFDTDSSAEPGAENMDDSAEKVSKMAKAAVDKEL